MSRFTLTLPLVLLLPLCAAAAQAAPHVYTTIPDQFIYCTTCHGVEFQGNRAVDAPRLAGLPAWYLKQQMQAFRNGWRGTHPEDLNGMEMRPQAMVLDDAAVDEIVALIAGIEPGTPAPESVAGDTSHGADLYITCGACHGAEGLGNELLAAPPLAGQSDWYLERQLNLYRSGVRGSAAGDGHGATMKAAAITLASAEDARDVVAYINTLSTTTAGETVMKNLAAPLLLAAAASTSAVAEVKRYPLPGSDFPIAQAVEVTAGTTLVYHSGMTPRPANPEAEKYSAAYWGDTEAQTLSVFSRLEESLKAKGLDFSNVIKMQIFLVGVPKLNGAMDFQGMMRAYRKYFGTEAQPNLPARSAFQVAGLAAPGMLVEIEVVLAR